jgi:hypothetical protein
MRAGRRGRRKNLFWHTIPTSHASVRGGFTCQQGRGPPGARTTRPGCGPRAGRVTDPEGGLVAPLACLVVAFFLLWQATRAGNLRRRSRSAGWHPATSPVEISGSQSCPAAIGAHSR